MSIARIIQITLCFLKRRLGKFTAFYVDNMITTKDDSEEIQKLQVNLAFEFEMKYLGELKYLLGVEVPHSPKGIFLSQQKYVFRFVKRDCEDHMDAVMRILTYLNFAPGKGILYGKHGHLKVEGFTNAYWVGNVTNRRSTSGYFTFVGGNLVTWCGKKQKVVPRLSAEAEYRGMAHEICELFWLRKLLRCLDFEPKKVMELYFASKSVREIVDNAESGAKIVCGS
ncbi:unnamed protein product [Malus baccata var. baccata]